MVLRIKGELDLVALCRRDGVRIEDKPAIPHVDADDGPEGCCGEQRAGQDRNELHV